MDTMTGIIIAPHDQLILLGLNFFQTGEKVEVRLDPDKRWLRIRKIDQKVWFSIYSELIQIT